MPSRITSPPKTSNSYKGDYMQVQNISAAELKQRKLEAQKKQERDKQKQLQKQKAAVDGNKEEENPTSSTPPHLERTDREKRLQEEIDSKKQKVEIISEQEEEPSPKSAEQALLEELLASPDETKKIPTRRGSTATAAPPSVSSRRQSMSSSATAPPPPPPPLSRRRSVILDDTEQHNTKEEETTPPTSILPTPIKREKKPSASSHDEDAFPSAPPTPPPEHFQEERVMSGGDNHQETPTKPSLASLANKGSRKSSTTSLFKNSSSNPPGVESQSNNKSAEKAEGQKPSSQKQQQQQQDDIATTLLRHAATGTHPSSSSRFGKPFASSSSSTTNNKNTTNKNDEIKPKSLWLALVLKNPFFYAKKNRPHIPPPNSLKGYSPDAAAAHAGTAFQNQANLMKKKKNANKRSASSKKKDNSSNMMSNSSFIIDTSVAGLSDSNGQPKIIELDEETSNFIQNETTFLQDDAFLKKPNFLLKKDLDAPNDFQKFIELLLRLKKRQLHVVPSDVLQECDEPPAHEPWNFLEGYTLRESRLLLSPDGDEAYFRFHANRETLTNFAEKQSLTLRTNPYSYLGGVGAAYTKKTDEDLAQSVRDYMKHFVIPEEDAYCKGKLEKKNNKDNNKDNSNNSRSKLSSPKKKKPPSSSSSASKTNNNTPIVAASNSADDDSEYNGWGFCLEVPQKMRLIIRLLREGWVFGGCGLQLDEMKELGILVVSYFPLHNENYLKDYEIDKWADFSAMLDSRLVLKENELALIHYFGEAVAIYFSWMRQYVLYLIAPAAVGVICGIIMEVDGLRPAAIGGVFSVLMVLYMCSWMRKWQRYEGRFVHRWGQDIEQKQELVRDRFVYERKNIVDVNTIFTMQFEFPLTMHRMSDGTMVELHFQHRRRLMRRYLVSYPIILLVTSVMIAALYYTQKLRFDNVGDLFYSIVSSVLSVIISLVFGKIFNVLVQLLNLYENARTESENDNELITKSFVFYFVSTYFATFAIALWPSDGSFDESTRLFQLKSQLIVELAALPIVQNIVELAIPRFGAIFRRKVDETGSIANAILALFCCCCPCGSFPESDDGTKYQQKQREMFEEDEDYDDENNKETSVVPITASAPSSSTNNNKKQKNTEFEEGTIEHKIWSEAQLEPYSNTSEDFLEIALQYGWSVMFAAIFPWAPFLALVFNVVEIRVDAVKLIRFCQRPVAKVSASIGGWLNIFWSLNIFAVVTNSYYVIFISTAVEEVGLDTSHEARLQYFIYSQYFFIILIGIILAIRSDTSPTSKKAQVKADLLRDRAVQDFVTRSLSANEEDLKKQSEERMKRFVLVSGGEGGNEEENSICSIETLMNICLPSFCIPQGDDSVNSDYYGNDEGERAEMMQQGGNNNNNNSFTNNNNNSMVLSSSPSSTSMRRGTSSFGGSGLSPKRGMTSEEIQNELDKQKRQEQEATLLKIGWARLNRREELYEKTMAKNAKSPSSNFQIPKASLVNNNSYYNHQRGHREGGNAFLASSSSPSSSQQQQQLPPHRSKSSLKMLPGETEDEFVDRIIAQDRRSNPFEGGNNSSDNSTARRGNHTVFDDDYDL